jgi:hypothetical protein
VAPYSLSPWKPADIKSIALLEVLRGDFFCLPFSASKVTPHPHGEPANLSWNLKEQDSTKLVLNMKVKGPKCNIRKTVSIRKGQRAVYQEHLITGLSGQYNYGHHAIIKFPDEGGPYHVNTSPFFYGSVKPDPFSNPLDREYGALKTGARFNSLFRVPLATGGTTSLNEYPARRGFEDLIMLASRKSNFAWTAVTLDGYVWLAFKDPEALPNTLFWITNGGRHGAPWNGRHVNRLGLEEVCSHFSDSPEISRKDLLKRQGVTTSRRFFAGTPTTIRVIHAVHPVPKNFGMVTKITRDRRGEMVTVSNKKGASLKVPVDWKFLYG